MRGRNILDLDPDHMGFSDPGGDPEEAPEMETEDGIRDADDADTDTYENEKEPEDADAEEEPGSEEEETDPEEGYRPKDSEQILARRAAVTCAGLGCMVLLCILATFLSLPSGVRAEHTTLRLGWEEGSRLLRTLSTGDEVGEAGLPGNGSADHAAEESSEPSELAVHNPDTGEVTRIPIADLKAVIIDTAGNPVGVLLDDGRVVAEEGGDLLGHMTDDGYVPEGGSGSGGYVYGSPYYHVVWGDTLSKVSSTVHVSVQELAEYNHIDNVHLIYAESDLRIPVDAVSETEEPSAEEEGADTDVEDAE